MNLNSPSNTKMDSFCIYFSLSHCYFFTCGFSLYIIILAIVYLIMQGTLRRKQNCASIQETSLKGRCSEKMPLAQLVLGGCSSLRDGIQENTKRVENKTSTQTYKNIPEEIHERT